MFTSTNILLLIGVSLLTADDRTMYRASESRTVDIPIWPALATFGLAVVILGAAVLTT